MTILEKLKFESLKNNRFCDNKFENSAVFLTFHVHKSFFKKN